MDPSGESQAIVLADVLVEVGTRSISVKPGIRVLKDGGRVLIEAPIGTTGMNLVLTDFDSNTGDGFFQVARPPREYLHVEASLKPFILLLWVGTFVATLGLVISTLYRGRLAVRKAVKPKRKGNEAASKDSGRRAVAA
jgi:hypothetical protein